jgi:hypothetical protein
MYLPKIVASAAVLSLFGNLAQAQSIKSEVLASNGVAVTLYSDSFAGRYEFSSPAINLPNNGGFLFVSRVVQGNEISAIRVVGSIMYSGEWRRYNSAIFRGGVEADGSFNDRDVVSCVGSRYSGCSLREGFRITLTKEQIERHMLNGFLDIQVRAQSSDAITLSIPAAHFAAIVEVAKKP